MKTYTRLNVFVKEQIESIPLMVRLGAVVKLLIKVLPDQIDAEDCHCRSKPRKPGV